MDDVNVHFLLNQVATGDIKVAEQIFSLFQDSVFVFIRLQVTSDEVAEEILNDTFMIAFTKIAQFDGTSAFTTWLCGIAKNLCRNWRRKERRETSTFVKLDFNDCLLENFPDPGLSALECLEQKEVHRTILGCIEKLPEPHKEVLFFALFEGVSLDEISSIVSRPIGTIKSRLYYARAKVAECVRRALEIGVADV